MPIAQTTPAALPAPTNAAAIAVARSRSFSAAAVLALCSALLLCISPAARAQTDTASTAAKPASLGKPIVVRLFPQDPAKAGAMRWSPKGATVKLERVGDRLVGQLRFGPKDAPPIAIELSRSATSQQPDTLRLDLDRDGSMQDQSPITCTPREQRNKFWSSFTASIPVHVDDPWNERKTIDHHISLWYVFDPHLPDAQPVLRWSRRSYLTGSAVLDDAQAPRNAEVLICESAMDGRFDKRDSWALADASTPELARSHTAARDMQDHAWFGQRAYRLLEVDPSGLRIVIEPYDPGITRAAEIAQRDRLAADRRAVRSGTVVAFSHDFPAARARARDQGKPMLIDFETTWCGPCKQMDQFVYTADLVVAASAPYIAVKVDGDESRDLTERFRVRAYPTIILLDAAGKELRRHVGYLSVADTVEFLDAGTP